MSSCNLVHPAPLSPVARLVYHLVRDDQDDMVILTPGLQVKWGRMTKIAGHLAQIIVLNPRHTEIIL